MKNHELKVNELRVGNYLDHNPNPGVLGSSPNRINAGSILGLEVNPGLFNKNFRPIPLTEEWLLNLEFEETHRSKYRIAYTNSKNQSCGYEFNIAEQNNGMEGFRYFGHYIKLNYVHELQNIYFSLYKEEL